MTAAPGPQQPDEVEREAAAFMHLVRTLLMSYTPQGAVTWLTSRNRGLDMHHPIDRWTVGYETEVQEVADLIDGGLPAAPSVQPDEGPVWCLECRYDIGPYGSCDCYEPRPNRTPTQPVRDTEKGRRCRCAHGSDAVGPHTRGCPLHPEEGRR